MTRITSVELKKLLRLRFPEARFSVTRTRSWAANFMQVRFRQSQVSLREIQDFVKEYQSERDPWADGVELGSQSVSLYDLDR